MIIAAYNVRGCILRAIESVQNGQGVSVEILVIDDGSTDGTPAYVEELAAADPRIRLIRMPCNRGPSAARNQGLAHARGRWAAVLDADDAFLPGRLARLVAIAEADNADMVADNFATIDLPPPDHFEPVLKMKPGREWLDSSGFLRGARPGTDEADFGLLKPLFKVAFLSSHGLRYPEDVRHGEDFELVLRALLAGARYRLTREDLFYLYTSRLSGHSRTHMDYLAQVRRARWLAKDEAIRRDSTAVRLLHERSDALIGLDLHNLSYGSGRRPISPVVLLRAVQSAAGRRWLAKWCLAHVR